MELLYILVISLLAALLSLVPVGKRFAPGVTFLSALAVFLLSLRAALATTQGVEFIAFKYGAWCRGKFTGAQYSCTTRDAAIFLL